MAAADFHKDLKRGKEAEEAFIKMHPWNLVDSGTRAFDFKGDKKDKITGWNASFEGRLEPQVELKSDFYDPNKTENLFIERWSNLEKQKPGGLWQSHANGADVFCYWFVKGGFWLECRKVPELIEHLEDRIETIKPFRVLNRGWITIGYRVPRNTLKSYFDIYRVGR